MNKPFNQNDNVLGCYSVYSTKVESDPDGALQLPFVPHLAGVPLTHTQLRLAGKKTVTLPSSRTRMCSHCTP